MMSRRKRIAIDITMMVFLFASMAYAFTGNFIHEIAGTLVVILFAFHLLLNRRWLTAVPKGTYNPARTATLLLNSLLVVSVFVVLVSGLMLSHDLFPFLPSGKGLLAREIHTASAAWCFILASIHAGFHAKLFLSPFRFFRSPIWQKYLAHGIALLVSVLGVLAFFHRGLFGKLTLQTSFDAFSFNDSSLSFFADYSFIAALFFVVAHYAKTRVLARR